jgi:hypothetical protein
VCSLLFLTQSRDKRLDIDELSVRCILEYYKGIVLRVRNFLQNLFVSDFRNLIVFEFLLCFPNCFPNLNHLQFINLVEELLVSNWLTNPKIYCFRELQYILNGNRFS